MLPFSTFIKIPSFFLYGFKYGGHRHPDKSYRILKPTIFALSFKSISLSELSENKLKTYYPNEDYYADIETGNQREYAKFIEKQFSMNSQDFFRNLIKTVRTIPDYIVENKNGADLSFNIVDFKIHSETNISDPTKWYYVSIGIIGTKVKPDTPTMVYCSCPDFRYTFSYVLRKYGALLYDNEFPPEFKTIPPKKRNPYQIPWGCKHVYTIARYIFENRDKFSFTEEYIKKFNLRNNPDKARPNLNFLIKLEKYFNELKRRYKHTFNIFAKRRKK